MHIITHILHRSLAMNTIACIYYIYNIYQASEHVDIATVALKCNTSYMLLTCFTSC